MAGRSGPCHGSLAGPLSRHHERSVAGGLWPGLPAGEPDLRAALHRDRLARHVVGRHSPGPALCLHSLFREGIGGLAGKQQEAPGVAQPGAGKLPPGTRAGADGLGLAFRCRGGRRAPVLWPKGDRAGGARRPTRTQASATDLTWISIGFELQGAFTGAIYGLQPAYLTERFPTEVRGTASPFCYHFGTILGGLMPPAITYLAVDKGLGSRNRCSTAPSLAPSSRSWR